MPGLPVDLSGMVKPPFNYTGCKFKLLPQLIPLFDYERDSFVDLFTGGGSVWCNLAPYYDRVIANDIIGDLVDIQRLLLSGDGIVAETQALCVEKTDKAGYHALRDDYNQRPSAAKLWALMLCCNNNMMRFNAARRFNQTFGRRSWNASTTEKVARYTSHIRSLESRIAHMREDFEAVPIPPGSMVYVDPPYSNTEAGYNSYWKKNDDVRLFAHLQHLTLEGHAIAVSGVREHNGKRSPLIDMLEQAGWHVSKLEADYNVVSKVGLKQTDEVVLTNYNVACLVTHRPTTPAAMNGGRRSHGSAPTRLTAGPPPFLPKGQVLSSRRSPGFAHFKGSAT
jgi:DNA adenine methylase Dam